MGKHFQLPILLAVCGFWWEPQRSLEEMLKLIKIISLWKGMQKSVLNHRLHVSVKAYAWSENRYNYQIIKLSVLRMGTLI